MYLRLSLTKASQRPWKRWRQASQKKRSDGMLAIDTDVVVRYLTGDDPQQASRARALIDDNDVYVCTTVLLETAWVLRSAYDYDAGQVAKALRAFAGLPHVEVEDAGLTAQALDWMEAGLDFADALHLARTQDCEAFVSFDKNFIRAANRLSAIKVQAP
jgi:predicted nucleic-acid-binding protein